MKRRIVIGLSLLLVFSLACSQLDMILNSGGQVQAPAAVPVKAESGPAAANPTPTQVNTEATAEDVADVEEPVLISGTIPFTSPFFMDTVAEPFVFLQDQSGFVERDGGKPFALSGQTLVVCQTSIIG